MPHARDGRRRELRELLVSAANVARRTREDAMNSAMSGTESVRDATSGFLAAAR